MRQFTFLLGLVISLPLFASSHPPIRPLAAASDRPLTMAKRSFYVDPTKGHDASPGSLGQPWKTLAHAVKQLQPGDVLYLRAGTYYERTKLSLAGTKSEPITIRSVPGEIAILDGGLREFFENPATSWEPSPNGAPGEYRSTKTYDDPDARADSTNVLGHFGDSMVPLQGYKFLADLRSDNVYWNVKNKVGQEGHIYCGPGLYHDPATGRIHVRLAHTKMPYLPDADNYTGETDPRKLPLVIAGQKADSTLTLEGCRFVNVQDLVLRGSRAATVTVLACEGIDFDGLTVYSGQSCFRIHETGGLRLWNCACRGISAPWTFRGSLKYRAIEARIVSAAGWKPTPIPNRDFEFAYCEFTDSVDGVFVGGVRNIRIHHNLFDNITDDGIFLTSGTGFDGITRGGNVEITQNLFTHCLTCFAFGVGHGRQRGLEGDALQTGSGVHVSRNVFDLRDVIRYHQPASPGEPQELSSHGRVMGDHGSPAWEPMNIYHNTVLFNTDRIRNYPLGDGAGRGTRRRILNNVVVESEKLPGLVFPVASADFIADANLHWSAAKGSETSDPLAKFRASKLFTDSKAKYAPGWTTNDRFADPKFGAYTADGKQPADLTLKPESPAVDAGLPIPAEWPDALRASDKGKPDLGAIPAGVEPWAIGVRGRLSVFGQPRAVAKIEPGPLPTATPFEVPAWKGKPAAMVVGYPAPVSELFEFAIRRQGVKVVEFDKTWLDTKEYDKYSAVFILGSLTRAKASPDQFSAEDLKRLDAYLKAGGTLVVVLQGKLAFQSPEAQVYLQGLTGISPVKKGAVPKFELLQPSHPWVKHLDAKAPQPWQKAKFPGEHILRTGTPGERIVGTADGQALLYRVKVGQGQLIYMGWDVHDALPYTRDRNPTPEGERSFDAQMKVLFEMAADIFPAKR